MALANEAQPVPGREPSPAPAEIAPLASLRARLTLIMILALIPAGIFLIFDVITIRRDVRTEAQADLLRLSEVAAKSYNQQLDEAHRLMAAIALFPEVHGDNAADCAARLGQMVALNQPKYQGFAVVNLNGTVLCSSPQITATVQLADRLWFTEAVRTGQFAIGEFTIGRPIGVPVLGLGYPVLDERGDVTRVVAHGMTLRQFQDRVDDLPLPPDAVMTITDHDGIILARVPGGEQWAGKRQIDTNLQELYRRGQGEVEAQGVDGVNRLYAFTPISGPSGTQVWLSIGRTPEAIYAEVGPAVTRDLLGIGAVLLAALAAFWVGSDWLLLRRIDRLATVSTQLAGGDWQVRVPVPSKGDELDHLGLTFNHMADTLLRRRTEQQRVQAVLQERERHLYLALQAARMVAWTWDIAEDRVYTTDNLPEIYGVSAVEYGKQGFSMVHPDDLPRHQEIVNQALEDLTAYRSEFRIVRPDNGQTVWIDERAVPILDNTGHLQRIAGVVLDITERKHAESELAQAREQLEERVRERTAELERSNRELNQFAYVASHDLKAPLRAIEHLAHWISEDAEDILPPHSQEHLAKMRGRVRRMEQLLDDLLAYSRAGRVRPPSEVVETESLLQDVVAVLGPPSGFTVTFEGAAPVLRTPRASLELVLRNLIGNALKHHKSAHGNVRVCAFERGEMVEFEVSDDGPGIDPQYHERIFEMFQTLQPRDKTEGSGMGLAIVKKLVESYGGVITVESTGQNGTTFRFTWPRWVEDEADGGGVV